MSGILTGSLESSGTQRSSAKTIEIDGRGRTRSVAFLVGGKHVMSGDKEGKIRRWRVEDGMEVGAPMDVGSDIFNIAVSRDGKWVVSGTGKLVHVWKAEGREKMSEFEGHSNWVLALDVSPDSKRIASGSGDKTASVWSLSTGQRLLGPWKHDDWVFAVKFSPDGCFIATATETFIRIYDSRDGSFLVDVPVRVTHSLNCSLAWSSNSKRLFAVSSGRIVCLDASTGATLSPRSFHGDKYNCIALASDGTFIAASSDSSVSFWDATTHKQIGSVVHHTARAGCMAISANHDIVIGGDDRITLRSLCDILPPSYCSSVSTFESRTRFASQQTTP